MTQRIIEWPRGLKPSAQEWELLMPVVSSTSAFSGATFNALIGPPRWAFSMDLSDAPVELLPEIEATLRQLRNGLNLLRIGDHRRIGKMPIAPGGERWAKNLLPWSVQMQRWAVAGPAPVAVGGGLKTLTAMGAVAFATDPIREGFTYVLSADVSAPVSAKVALSLSNGSQQLGVIFDALTGRELSRYGGVLSVGRVKSGDGWKVWLTFACAANSTPQAQIHALLATKDTTPVTMSKPVIAQASTLPPVFVETTATPVYADVAVVIDGAGQAGDMLSTRGWVPGSKIRQACWINYGDGLHQVLGAVLAGKDGRAQLWIEPPIRRSPADGQAVTVRNVLGVFRLKAGPKIRQEGLLVPGQTLTFEEYLS